MSDTKHAVVEFARARLARRLAAAAALASLTLLTACGGGSGDSQSSGGDVGVASVTEGDRNPTKVAQVERPLIRPDTSQEEEERLWQVYYDCLAQQGLKLAKNEGEGYEGTYKGIAEQDQKKVQAAKKGCAAKEPETLPERASREDPKYQDKYDKWLDCMRSHGLKVEAAPDQPGTFGFTEGLPPESKAKWIRKCEAEAFVTE